MNGDISFGLMLMAVGMLTVFSILALVVMGGKIMIILINRFAPLPDIESPALSGSYGIAKTKVAAITAAVETITGGKGKITEINKE
jgi:oxaloacetate decarboxylase gamma subunit